VLANGPGGSPGDKFGIAFVAGIVEGNYHFMKRSVLVFITLIIVGIYAGCTRVDQKLKSIDPVHVTKMFLESWKRKDWKTMYSHVHPGIIQHLRSGELTQEQAGMSDQDLFISEMEKISSLFTGKELQTYELTKMSVYKKGMITLWVDVRVNGKERRLPLTLSGTALKVDLTKL
jgi:hypothetical protein